MEDAHEILVTITLNSTQQIVFNNEANINTVAITACTDLQASYTSSIWELSRVSPRRHPEGPWRRRRTVYTMSIWNCVS